MRKRIVRERPICHAEMTGMETIVLAARRSTAVVPAFNRIVQVSIRGKRVFRALAPALPGWPPCRSRDRVTGRIAC